MRKFIVSAAIIATALAFAMPAGATPVNLDGITNASLDGSNAVSLHLGVGTWDVTFVKGAFTAFSRWNQESGCDSTGQHCTQGWENSAVIAVGSQTYYLGDSGGNGGIGPVSGEDGYFESAALSFAHSAMYSQQITLTAPTDVGFYIYDNILTDNRGGISLAVVAVPEPSTWPLWIAGFGMLGLLALRRRKPLQA